jgi:hypothetical protein
VEIERRQPHRDEPDVGSSILEGTGGGQASLEQRSTQGEHRACQQLVRGRPERDADNPGERQRDRQCEGLRLEERRRKVGSEEPEDRDRHRSSGCAGGALPRDAQQRRVPEREHHAGGAEQQRHPEWLPGEQRARAWIRQDAGAHVDLVGRRADESPQSEERGDLDEAGHR